MSAGELDERVYAHLPTDPIPAIDLSNALGLDWIADGKDLRASLLRLQEQGRAGLIYGRGWFRL